MPCGDSLVLTGVQDSAVIVSHHSNIKSLTKLVEKLKRFKTWGVLLYRFKIFWRQFACHLDLTLFHAVMKNLLSLKIIYRLFSVKSTILYIDLSYTINPLILRFWLLILPFYIVNFTVSLLILQFQCWFYHLTVEINNIKW
jgi:hypothetical protein